MDALESAPIDLQPPSLQVLEVSAPPVQVSPDLRARSAVPAHPLVEQQKSPRQNAAAAAEPLQGVEVASVARKLAWCEVREREQEDTAAAAAAKEAAAVAEAGIEARLLASVVEATAAAVVAAERR
jgi:hypothetical protein